MAWPFEFSIGWRYTRQSKKAGKKNGCLIEGMGCPGGCIAGAGTNVSVEKAAAAVKKLVDGSSKPIPPKDLYEIDLP